MNVKIRKANIDDIENIKELNNKLFIYEYENFDSSLNVGWPFTEEGDKYFRDIILNEIVFVAIDDEKIVGYLAGTVDTKISYILKPISELDNFYIEESYRRCGIGSMLVDEFKRYCKSNGIDEMKVTASASNFYAIEFYKKNGFNDFEITLKTTI